MGLEEQCVAEIRALSIDMVQAANSGHPGMPLGMAPAAHVLFARVMTYAASQPNFPNRDRFVLSNGHGCALLYSMLHLCGNEHLTMEQLKNFRQYESLTPGHPESHITPGVEVTTGPLGQGIAMGVGMAIARKHVAARFNKPDFDLINHKVYVFCGDGCLQEGVASEAASLAGHLKLSDLVVIYDDNKIQIDGTTDLAFTENVLQRFDAYGWHTATVEGGDADLDAIEAAIREAAASTDKPTIIALKTTIGFASPPAGTAKAHGSPLGEAGVAATKEALGLDASKSFHVSEEVRMRYTEVQFRNAEHVAQWQALFEQYSQQFPKEAAEFRRIFIEKELPPLDEIEAALPKFSAGDKATATRALSGQVLNAVAPLVTELVGGSADLSPSNKTELKCSHDFAAESPEGRYIRFGVREFGMAAIGNGLASYGLVPYTATFLNFLTYAFPAVRLAALSHVQQLFVMTHDSIGLGEDGPTHQPVEVLPLCRATPNLLTLRPADGNETSGCYLAALEHRDGPSVLCLSRQNLPHLEASSIEKTQRGAYVVKDTEGKPDLVLVASGSEVSAAVEAAAVTDKKVRVVSMPCGELFEQQEKSYRRSTLPLGVPTVFVEASSVFGLDRYAHKVIGMTTFGLSAPAKKAFEHFGLLPTQIAQQADEFLASLQANAADLGVDVASLVGVLPVQL